MYGGGLWHTWFDRDLTIAGKVIVKQEKKLVPKFWSIPEPCIRIPNLAIHLTTNRGEGFNPSVE